MLLPVRTVGVMGDYGTYDHVVGLRAVTSSDGTTARAQCCKTSLPDQRLFPRLSLRDPRLVVAPRAASVLRYLTCSMNARSLGKT